MAPRSPLLRSGPAHGGTGGGAGGQLLVLFALALMTMIAVAGLLMDAGAGWVVRREAQAAADTAALAAAKVAGRGNADDAFAAAASIADANGFDTTYVDCSGTPRSDGVVLSIPPVTGSHVGDDGYVEVTVRRVMPTAFAAALGQDCWPISARAVAAVITASVATCTFCSLNGSHDNHTLVLKNSATLRVDGDIYVNSRSGGYTPTVCIPLQRYKVCGDGFDVFGAGGYISAKTISTVGGWETHDKNIATADALPAGCTEYPNPPFQAQLSNVCIHRPPIADPLNDPARPTNIVRPPTVGPRPVAGLNGCPVGAAVPTGTAESPVLYKITGGVRTICPGTYFGGLQISGGSVTMLPGVHVMIGGGFQVLGSAGIDGSAGVMIYSVGGGSAGLTTSSANDLVPYPVAGHIDLKPPTLVTSSSTTDPGHTVTFTVTLTPVDAKTPMPIGTVDFYNGSSMICGSAPVVTTGKDNKAKAVCTTTFELWGTYGISAVYNGDTRYNAAGDTVTQTVRAPSGTRTGPITIDTSGPVNLSGPTSGPYAGLTIFQERASNLTITLAPGASSAAACPGDFMTRGVPPNTAEPPAACGAIGGLQGTIYAPADDALVLIEASGMANLQVIAGQIEVDSSANARFGYQASYFVNGRVHLVE